MNNGYQWFRMYTDFLDDPKMISLAFEDQRHFIGVLALKCSGILDQECEIEILDRIVARKLWIEHAIISDMKTRLVDVGLIDNLWQPIAWDSRQMKSDHDKTAAERQRRHREKKKKEASNALPLRDVTLLEKRRTEKKREDTIRQNSGANPKQIRCPYSKIVDLWHEKLPMLPTVARLNDTRKREIKARWKQDLKTLDDWSDYFDYVSDSKFLTGMAKPHNGGKRFVPTIDFFIKSGNLLKIEEGKYHG